MADTSHIRMPHLTALDGLRGVAVAAVVTYHLSPSLLPGGFLGVDLFFVLSGFLITSLVLRERKMKGRLDLKGFYVRRLRRLAPALLAVIAALGVYALVAAQPAEAVRIRTHGLWSLAWLANWRFVLDGTTYTDVIAGASPLRHMWSLAIEEQFYLVFPALVIALGVAAYRLGVGERWLVGTIAGAGALMSAVAMAVVASRADGTAGLARAYFGTDTRAHGLLIGVVLGALLLGLPPTSGKAARCLRLAVVPALGVLVVAMGLGGETALWMYFGGFVAVGVATAVVIAAVGSVRWLRTALEWRPLVALGVISYGVYLWHWPVIVLVNRSRTGLDGLPLVASQLALTLAVAIASYFLLERPIRRGALGQLLGRWSVATLPLAAVALLAVLIVGSQPQPLSNQEALQQVAVESSRQGPTSGDQGVTVGGIGSDHLQVVVMGDSVAHTLAGGTLNPAPGGGFEPWQQALSPFDPARVRIHSMARPQCSYVPGRVVSRAVGVGTINELDTETPCGDWRGQLDTLLAEGPDLVIWASAIDISDRNINGTEIVVGTPEWETVMEDTLGEVADIVDRAGAHLVLLALPPRSEVFYLEADNANRWREAALHNTLERFVAPRTSVSLLDLANEVCPQDDCTSPSAGFDPAWRFDGLHYDIFGAFWFAEWVTPQLQSLARVGSEGAGGRTSAGN